MRKTKIICTLGPAVDSDEMVEKLINAGMNCARLNFSHGTHDEHLVRIERIRRVAKKLNKEIPILLDTKGPEIRIRLFENGSVDIKEGQEFTLFGNYDYVGNELGVGLSYVDLYKSLKVDDVLLIDDGKISFKVKKIVNKDIICQALNSGKLSNRKSINIPNVVVDQKFISENDKSDLIFGCEQHVDYVAASFTRTKKDIEELRALLNEHGGEKIKIISKIENTQGIECLDEIIDVSDGIMVARGDMGVEVSFDRLPHIQKDMISKCYKKGKQVVTATQMLESMTNNPRPTRAEVSDVANAVYDRTTAIMLSGESAAGKYPIEAVKTMSMIAASAEESIDYEKRYKQNRLDLGCDAVNAIANAAVNASFQVNAKAIIVVTRFGKTAQMISNYRPKCPIIAVTVDPIARRQLNLAWGVVPTDASEQYTTDDLFKHGIEKAKETGLIKKGDIVVITGGNAIGNRHTDTLTIHEIR